MTYFVETCGTAVKIVAAAFAFTLMILALTVGMTASGIVGLAGSFKD